MLVGGPGPDMLIDCVGNNTFEGGDPTIDPNADPDIPLRPSDSCRHVPGAVLVNCEEDLACNE